VLESAPFVVAGALLALVVETVPRLRGAAPLIALVSPGCDCTQNGFARALSAAHPAFGMFALTWGSACGPAALLATHAALGGRLLAARIAGGAVAATVNALLFVFTNAGALSCGARRADEGEPFDRHLGGAFGAIVCSAIGAAALAAFAPRLVHVAAAPIVAAIAGVVLTPCATADAVLAAVLFHDPASQGAFLIAAQCADIRQLALLARRFGAAGAAVALVGAGLGCACAAWIAR